MLAHVAELTATVHNRGNVLADETTTRVWVRGSTSTGNCAPSTPQPSHRVRKSRSPRCGTFTTGAVDT